MSNDDQSNPEPQGYLPHDDPDWKSDLEYTRARIAFDEPDLAKAYAAFLEIFPYALKKDKDGKVIDPSQDNDAYLYLLLQSEIVKDAHTFSEWKQCVEEYPKSGLTEEQAKLSGSPRIQSRAHYLASALTSLMRINKAPPAMVADLQAILGLNKPRAAEISAAAQKALADNPNASARAIARGLKKNPKKHGKDRDHGQISKDLKKGKLVRPVGPFDNNSQRAK